MLSETYLPAEQPICLDFTPTDSTLQPTAGSLLQAVYCNVQQPALGSPAFAFVGSVCRCG